MSELKPIEAGCMAVTINCNNLSNNGRFVTVLKDLGILNTFGGLARMWEIDGEFVDILGNQTNIIRTSKLLRIDDPDLKEDKTKRSGAVTLGYIDVSISCDTSNLKALSRD